jgi:hypothetical protein
MTKHRYGLVALTASGLLLLLSAVLLCSCPVVTFLAGVFAVIAFILTEKGARLVSVLLIIAGFSAAYFDYQNQGKLLDRARQAVRQADENVRAEKEGPPQTLK